MRSLIKKSKSNFRRCEFESLEAREMRSGTPNNAALLEAQPLTASTAVVGSSVGGASSSATTSAAASHPSSSLLSPAQLRHAYNLDNVANNGAGQTIAIIGAFNDPHIQSDLNVFDQTYGLPSLQLNIQQQTLGYVPPFDAAWARETAMDVEWAHAAAPGAKIELFEANTGSLDNLLAVVDLARKDPNVSVVSMSFSASPSVAESNMDFHFTTPAGHIPMTFIAGSGDSGSAPGAQYPAASPKVLAVGGTSLTLYNGNYFSENGWSSSGGGQSHYEAKPAYQSFTTYDSRTTPDVSFDADIVHSGVNVYHSAEGGWTSGGGTSLGAPSWAGIIAVANQGRVASGHATLGNTVADLYSLSSHDFNDIVVGNNGDYSAKQGYDLVTGLGSPNARSIIIDLQTVEPPTGTHAPIPTGPRTGGTTTTQSTGATASNSSWNPTAQAIDPTMAGMPSLNRVDAASIDRLFAMKDVPASHPAAVTVASPKPNLDLLLGRVDGNDEVDHLVDSLFQGQTQWFSHGKNGK